MARAARALFLASHPGPVLAVTVMSVAYCRSVRRDARGTLKVALAVLAGQLSVGWQNDALDVARDRAAARADKPAASGAIEPRHLEAAALLAGACCVPLSLSSGRRAGLVHLGCVASAYAYNLGLKATPFSIVPYVASFGALPVFVTLGESTPYLAPWWAVTATALLGGGAHVANVLPDLEDDRAAGVVGLPHRLSRRHATTLMGSLLVGATAVLALGGPGKTAVRVAGAAASLALAGVALRAADKEPNSRRPFFFVIVIAVLDVALLLLESASERGAALGNL